MTDSGVTALQRFGNLAWWMVPHRETALAA